VTAPASLDEWQEAVDCADLLVALEAAREYGVMIDGPEVNLERCYAILEEGRARGIVPRPRATALPVATTSKEGSDRDHNRQPA
jgi:hypothetical protein